MVSTAKTFQWIVVSALTAAACMGQTKPAAEADGPGSDFVGNEPTGKSKPAPRTLDGHPDMNGYWKGSRQTKPVGNIAKDLPGFELPFTPAGRAADEYNRTKTIDPESLCIIGGVPRHSASGLPFMIMQTPNAVAFLYFYS
ncbi:MAG: hypothetical protein ABSH09_35055 [Bryobacteraceae bacterium]